MTRRYRPRKQFSFQLYHDLNIDVRLMDYIKWLRSTKQFATTVRNGLRLMWTLGEGDLSVLFELFPGLQSKLMPKNDELIEQFRQMLVQHQPLPVAQSLATAPSLPAGAPPESRPIISNFKIVLSPFDDEDTIVIRRDEAAGSTTAENFLSAVFGLQQNNDADREGER
jgi:hypothetical protein